MSSIKASIDIGSNSCLLLVGEVQDGKVLKVLESHSFVTGLGRELDQNKKFAEVSMKETFEALSEYKKICLEHGIKPEDIVATATEASRVATNAPSFYSKIENEIGIKVNIITSDAEAYFSATGVLCDTNELPDPLHILDIGGASTELINLDLKTKELRSSFSMPVGSVRYTTWLSEGTEKHNLVKIFDDYAENLQASKTKVLCCVAGTMTSIANMHLKNPKFIEDEVHGITMDRVEIEKMKSNFKDYTPQDFLEEFPFLGKRANTIKAGIAIICAIMDVLEVQKTYISTYGLRYGTLIAGRIDNEFIA